MNKIFFLIILIFFHIINLFPSSSKNFSLNRVEKRFSESEKTKLTKENFNGIVKRTDTFDYKNSKDILHFVTTPKKILEKEIEEELKKFNWTLDQNFINQLNILINNDDKIILINKKISKLHNQTETPILVLANDIIYEINKAKELSNKIKIFIGEQQTKKVGSNNIEKQKIDPEVYIAKLNAFLQTLAKSKNNAQIISNVINSIFKVKK